MSLRLKLRALFNPKLQQDLDDELAFHVEMRAAELEREGIPPADALRRARRQFGNYGRTVEQTRDQHVFRWLEVMVQDLRYAIRRLLREPVFSMTAIATLALVIGANGAVFSLVEAVLLRPLPFPHPEQLMLIFGRSQESNQLQISLPDLEEYRKARSFSMIAATNTQSVNLTGVEEPTRLIGGFVSSEYFAMLRVQPQAGRLLQPDDDKPGAARVCVLSNPTWQDRFGGDPAILGRSLILNGEPYTVAGVLPRSFDDRFMPAGVFLPFSSFPNYSRQPDRQVVLAMGRLADGVSLAQARAEVDTIAASLQAQNPAAHQGIGAAVVPLREQLVRNIRQTLWILAGGVICVLLIGCSNIAGLLVTKAAGRKQEIALRISLGAGRGRLVGQLLTESLLLALLGGLLGIVLASAGMGLTNRFLPDLARGTELVLNRSIVAYLLAISFGTGILFGLAPAWFARRQTAGSLRQRGGAASPLRVRNVLVAAQMALALVLLVGAGLMLKSLARMTGVDPGFRGERVLTMEYRVPRNKYPAGNQQLQFHREVVARVSSLPGVESVALVGSLPFSGNSNMVDIGLPDRPAPAGKAPFSASYIAATPGYFRTAGIPLLGGRDFAWEDAPGSHPVAIVSRSFAQRYWPGTSPIGRQVTVPLTSSAPAEVVGLVGDVKENGLEDPGIPQIYVASNQHPALFSTLVVRTKGEPLAMTRPVQRAIWSIDKDQPMWKIRTLQYLVDRSYSYRRYTLILLAAFSLLALLLAAIGLYGVIGYTVMQRTAELGIRAAIGATPRDLFRLVLGKGAALIGAGLLCGLAASLLATRYLRTQVFEIDVLDPATYLTVGLLLLVVGLFAIVLPARRAMQIDPVSALRQE